MNLETYNLKLKIQNLLLITTRLHNIIAYDSIRKRG